MDLKSLLSNSIKSAADRVFGESQNSYSDVMHRFGKSGTVSSVSESGGDSAVQSISRELIGSLRSLSQPISLPTVPSPGSGVGRKGGSSGSGDDESDDVQDWAFGDPENRRRGSIKDDARTLSALTDSVSEVGRAASGMVAGVTSRSSAADKSIQSLAKSAEGLENAAAKMDPKSDSQPGGISGIFSRMKAFFSPAKGKPEPDAEKQGASDSSRTFANAARSLLQAVGIVGKSAGVRTPVVPGSRTDASADDPREREPESVKGVSARLNNLFNRLVSFTDNQLRRIARVDAPANSGGVDGGADGDQPETSGNQSGGRNTVQNLIRRTMQRFAQKSRRAIRTTFPGRAAAGRRAARAASRAAGAGGSGGAGRTASGFFGRMFSGAGGAAGSGSAGGGGGAAGGGAAAGGAGMGSAALAGGIAILALVAAIAIAVRALYKLGQQGFETAMRVADYNGALIAAKTQLEVGRMLRDIQTAQDLGATGSEFIKSLNELEKAIRPISVALQGAGLWFLTILADIAKNLVNVLNKMLGFDPNKGVPNAGPGGGGFGALNDLLNGRQFAVPAMLQGGNPPQPAQPVQPAPQGNGAFWAPPGPVPAPRQPVGPRMLQGGMGGLLP